MYFGPVARQKKATGVITAPLKMIHHGAATCNPVSETMKAATSSGAPSVASTVGATTVDQHDGLTLSFDEARAQRIGQAIAVLLRNRQTIHDHERLGHLRQVEADVLHGLSSILAQIDQDPVREDPDEPHRPKVLDHEPVFHAA